MYKDKPEVFFNPDTKQKWLQALRDKINDTQNKLEEYKVINKPEDFKRIKRLENKIRELKLVQDNISTHSFIDKLQQKKEIVDKSPSARSTGVS